MNRTSALTLLTAGAAALAVPGAALAHTGVGETGGFAAGLSHPLGGLDHMLAMLAVGLWAAQLGGRALWSVPAAFVGVMVIGAIAGIAGVPVPMVELGILGSVLVLGSLIALGRTVPVWVATLVVGLFALLHGHAHGTEMPVAASGLWYGLGFASATALLHAAGLALGWSAQQVRQRSLLRLGGGAIAASGVLLLFA